MRNSGKLEVLKRVIVAQKEEIDEKFRRENIIQRECDFSLLRKHISSPNILAILGIRRCGKSVLSWQILDRNVLPYINFDDERLVEFKTEDFDKLLQAFYELYGDFEYIVLDEPHNIENWELFVNRLRRTKRVIITGSNSKMLSGELSTHLTGRYIDFVLFPFSFREFLEINDFPFKSQNFYSTKQIGLLKKMLEDYLKIGGFPEGYLFGREILVRIYGDIIEKDILKRCNVKRKITFKEFSKYLISNSPFEFSFSKLKNVFDIKDVHTLKNWLSLIENAYLVFVLERFSFKLKEQAIAPRKIYCIDTGLANAIGFKFSENKGRKIENLVAIELLRRKSYRSKKWEIYYWRDHQQNEVDFVIKEGLKVQQLIQVCHDIEDYRTRERETKGLLKASGELDCRNLLIITWDFEGEEEARGKKIKFIPLWKWLLRGSNKDFIK